MQYKFPPAAEGVSLVSPCQEDLVQTVLFEEALLVEDVFRDDAGSTVNGKLSSVGLLYKSGSS